VKISNIGERKKERKKKKKKRKEDFLLTFKFYGNQLRVQKAMPVLSTVVSVETTRSSIFSTAGAIECKLAERLGG
jgi:hypothetical protein